MASIGRVAGLKIVLEIDGSKMTKSLETAARNVKRVEGNLKDLNKSLKLNPTNSDLIKQKFELLGKAIDTTRSYLADLKNQYERLSQIQDPTQKQIDQMNNLQREISDTEKELQNLGRQYDSFGSVGIQQTIAVGEQMEQLGNKIKDVGHNIEAVGREWELIGAPLQALFGYSLKEAAGFEQGMANVKAVTQANDDTLEEMGTTARQWARKTVYSAEEVTDAYWYMGLAGLEAEESMDSLGGVLDLAAASNMDLGQTTSIIVDTMRALNMEFDETAGGINNTTHAANIFAATMSNSNTTTELMGETFKYVAPYIGALNGDLEDLALVTGLMASVGVKGSRGGTALRQAFANLTSPTEAQAQAMDNFNISLDDGFGNARDLRDVLIDLRNEFGGLDLQLLDANGELKDGEQLWEEYGDKLPATQMEKLKGVVDIFGKRALPGILGVINASQEDWDQLVWAIDNADESMVKINGDMMTTKDMYEKFGEEAGDSIMKVERAFGGLKGAAEAMRETRLDTLQGQLTLLKDNFNDLAIDIGNALLPYVNDFVKWLGKLVDKFRALDPETKEFLFKLGLIIAAIGPALIAIGKVVGAIGTVIKSIGWLIGAGGKILGFISAIVSAVGALPAIIIGLVVALVAYILTHWEEFKAALSEIWESIKELAIGLWEGIKWMFTDVWEKIKTFAVDTWNAIKDKATEIWTALKDKISEIWENIKTSVSEKITSLKDFLSKTWDNIKDSVTNSMTAVKTTMSNIWDTIKTLVTEKVTALKDKAVEIWTNIKNKVTEIVTAIKDKLSEIWQNIKTTISNVVEGIKDKVSSVWETIKSTVSNVVEGIKSNISNVWEGIKSTTQNVWERIKNLITKPIESAKNTVKSIIDKIKGFFPISLKNIFSNFKLPHLSWTWKDVGGILKVPSFSVDWYAKAMKNGMLLDGATIFGMNRNGQPMGGGEVGREWIVGENGLMSMIRGAVSQQQLSSDVIYSAVVRGMHDANVTVYMDGKKVTDQVARQAAVSADSQRRYFGAR